MACRSRRERPHPGFRRRAASRGARPPAVPMPTPRFRPTGPRPPAVAAPPRALQPKPLYGQIKGFGQAPHVLASVFSGYGQPPVSVRMSGVFDVPHCGPRHGVPYAESPYADPRIVAPPCPPPAGCRPKCPPGYPPPVVRPPRPCPPQHRRACPPGPPPPVVRPNKPCPPMSAYGYAGFGSADGLYGYR